MENVLCLIKSSYVIRESPFAFLSAFEEQHFDYILLGGGWLKEHTEGFYTWTILI